MVRFHHCSDALFSIYQYMKIGPREFKLNMTQFLCYLPHGTKHLQTLYGIACAKRNVFHVTSIGNKYQVFWMDNYRHIAYIWSTESPNLSVSRITLYM